MAPSIIEQLATFADKNDRAGYYSYLYSQGDPYGKLARSVVKQDLDAGRVARDYAFEVSRRYLQPLDEESWTAMSIALMQADLAARLAQMPGPQQGLNLSWQEIRAYHNAIFASAPFKLPAVAWTAEIPLVLTSNPAELWKGMLVDDFLRTSARVVRLVAQSVPPARQSDFVACLVRANVPLPFVPGLGSMYRLNRMMEMSMTPMAERIRLEQVGRNNGLTEKQNLALFYMDVVGCGLYTPLYFWNDLFGDIALIKPLNEP